MNRFRAVRFGAQTAQHIDRGWRGELRGSQTGHEHAAPDPAALFHDPERRVNRCPSTTHVFGGSHLTHHNAVPREQLLRCGRAPLRRPRLG